MWRGNGTAFPPARIRMAARGPSDTHLPLFGFQAAASSHLAARCSEPLQGSHEDAWLVQVPPRVDLASPEHGGLFRRLRLGEGGDAEARAVKRAVEQSCMQVSVRPSRFSPAGLFAFNKPVSSASFTMIVRRAPFLGACTAMTRAVRCFGADARDFPGGAGGVPRRQPGRGVGVQADCAAAARAGRGQGGALSLGTRLTALLFGWRDLFSAQTLSDPTLLGSL